MDPAMVILIGMGVVFSGLILLIIAIKILTGILSCFEKEAPEAVKETGNYTEASNEAEIDHCTLIAIASAAIAAETNTDAEGLRIISIKRV